MYHDAYEVYEVLDEWNKHGGPPDIDGMRQLFFDKPHEARRTFLLGQTLLHKCMDANVNHDAVAVVATSSLSSSPPSCRLLDVVHCILQAFPQAVETPDDNGHLPLHRLLLSRRWGENILTLVKDLVGRYPESVISTTSSGALPLHLSCQRRDNENVVAYLLTCFPDATQYRDGQDKFPLDYALEVEPEPSVAIVQRLIKQHPVLLSFADDQGRLPLHKLLRRSSHHQRYNKIVDLVVNSFPGSLRLQDGCRRQTPLLMACTRDNPLSQIYSCLRAWPEQVTRMRAATILNDAAYNGEMLPSSLASPSTTIEQVEQWLHQCPEAPYTQDLQGRLPVHYAVLSDNPAIVRRLLRQPRVVVTAGGTIRSDGHDDDETNANPGLIAQLSTADKDGRLPLHFAAASPKCSIEVLQLLMDAYPAGLRHEDTSQRLAWHYGDLARQDAVFEQTMQRHADLDFDLDLVPDEIIWDVLQVTADD